MKYYNMIVRITTSNIQQQIHSRTEPFVIFEFIVFEDVDQWNFFSNKQLWDFSSRGHWKVYYPTCYREGKFLLAVHLLIHSPSKATPKRPFIFQSKVFFFLLVIYEIKKSYFLVLEQGTKKDKVKFHDHGKMPANISGPSRLWRKRSHWPLPKKCTFSANSYKLQVLHLFDILLIL